jgi:hypothetical protein
MRVFVSYRRRSGQPVVAAKRIASAALVTSDVIERRPENRRPNTPLASATLAREASIAEWMHRALNAVIDGAATDAVPDRQWVRVHLFTVAPGRKRLGLRPKWRAISCAQRLESMRILKNSRVNRAASS